MRIGSFILVFSCAVLAFQTDIEIAFPKLIFEQPVDLQSAPDNSNRLFVVEQKGVIYGFNNSYEVSVKNELLNISSKVIFKDELGLLGLAFHPDFATNGYIFINYNTKSPLRSVIARFTIDDVDSTAIDVSSEKIILEIPQPHRNHNGGQLVFDSSGFLYVSVGDGGPGRDPQNNGQNPTNFLGTILKIDVNNDSFPHDSLKNYSIPSNNPFVGNTTSWKEEIWAYGFRNPWRFSIDFDTGQMWVADVGQDSYEEINLAVAGGNFGWKVMEGNHCFDVSTCDTTNLIMPFYEYGHDVGESITGGFIYRGEAISSLYGKYIYGDFEFGTVWALSVESDGTITNDSLGTIGPYSISSFGKDNQQEIFICDYRGKIYKISSKEMYTHTNVSELIPSNFALHSNYPNPFNPTTTISYDLPEQAQITLGIYDLLGKRIKTLVNQTQDAGRQIVMWDGTDDVGRQVSAGVYLYRIQAGQFTQTRKMLFLK